jgi:hypothetical protein
MSEWSIRQTSEDFLYVIDDEKGKLIHFNTIADGSIMDAFGVGVSWKSLDKLKERSNRKVFNWELSDKSLIIDGNNDNWILSFKMQGPPFKTISVALSPKEVEKLRNALFSSG